MESDEEFVKTVVVTMGNGETEKKDIEKWLRGIAKNVAQAPNKPNISIKEFAENCGIDYERLLQFLGDEQGTFTLREFLILCESLNLRVSRMVAYPKERGFDIEYDAIDNDEYEFDFFSGNLIFK